MSNFVVFDTSIFIDHLRTGAATSSESQQLRVVERPGLPSTRLSNALLAVIPS